MTVILLLLSSILGRADSLIFPFLSSSTYDVRRFPVGEEELTMADCLTQPFGGSSTSALEGGLTAVPSSCMITNPRSHLTFFSSRNLAFLCGRAGVFQSSSSPGPRVCSMRWMTGRSGDPASVDAPDSRALRFARCSRDFFFSSSSRSAVVRILEVGLGGLGPGTRMICRSIAQRYT